MSMPSGSRVGGHGLALHDTACGMALGLAGRRADAPDMRTSFLSLRSSSVRSSGRSGGFTLIELMIVVAIVGILAVTAIPSFLRFQQKSKTSEAKINLAAIRTIEEAYYAEQGSYVSAAPSPAAIPGRTKVPFGSSSFGELGWEPIGDVFFSYAVAVTLDRTGFIAEAAADLDGDGATQHWAFSLPDLSGNPAAAPLGCTVAGLSARQIGPCDPLYGQSIF